MDIEKMCNLLIEADSYFTGKYVNTEKINSQSTIKGYCQNDGCKTNEAGINALAVYILMLFKGSIKNDDYNDYDEYFLMWISDKLFNIHNESKGKKPKKAYMGTMTLNQAYDKYLKKHKVILDYWILLNIIPGLKNANLRYMAEFYKLLNNICKTIADYNDNGAESTKLFKNSKNCLNQYQNLYINIYKCKSYLHLLNKLKGIYDDFRVSAIQGTDPNNNLATNLKKLTKPDGGEMDAARGSISYNFSNSKCYPQKKNPTIPKASKPNPEPAPPIAPSLPESQEQRSLPPQPQQVPPSLAPSPEIQKKDQQPPPPPLPQPEEQKQDSSSPPQPPEQPKGNQEKAPSPPAKESSQLQLQNSPQSQEPKLETNQEGSDTSSKDPSSEQKDSGSIKLQNIFNIVKNTFEMYRSPFYNTYTDIGNRLYKKATSTLEDAYDKSIKFTGITINYVKDQLNKALENVPPSKEKKPEPSPSSQEGEKKESQNIQTPTSGGQSNDNPKEPPSTQDLDSPDSKKVNPSDSLPEKQSQTSVDSSSDTHSTEIGSKDLGTNVEDKTPQLVNSIDIFKGYNRPETVITVILIPIISLIIYKYLSYGWRKELKKKKNMKKVINLFGVNKTTKAVINSTDGKKKMQIIINSYTQKNQIKKSINIVYRKKSPLLNIYKLMQADPVPFINLFFLLIFFVYKRKRDIIES
ncbi:CIR protein [Plasmodium chabaudi chabaudi]|uniref:CIR protein n=1 Tax=Plasmodium chabaudi chabaudi TaxID=31271 RepID=A0A1C6W8W7_PLACU|nr:CIR protein [Plasmodium chabaudi chabaudi]